MSLNTSSTTVGTMQLVSKGSLIFGSLLQVWAVRPRSAMFGGNVGIGTTSLREQVRSQSSADGDGVYVKSSNGSAVIGK